MSKFAAIGDKFSFINKVTEILLLLYWDTPYYTFIIHADKLSLFHKSNWLLFLSIYHRYESIVFVFQTIPQEVITLVNG